MLDFPSTAAKLTRATRLGSSNSGKKLTLLDTLCGEVTAKQGTWEPELAGKSGSFLNRLPLCTYRLPPQLQP